MEEFAVTTQEPRFSGQAVVTRVKKNVPKEDFGNER